MNRPRVAGVLWLIAGLSSAGIAFFLTDPLTLALFIVGAAVGAVMGLALLLRPAEGLVGWSTVAGVAWLVAYGAVALLNITNPIEEVLSVVWIIAFGVLGAFAAYRWRPGPSAP